MDDRRVFKVVFYYLVDRGEIEITVKCKDIRKVSDNCLLVDNVEFLIEDKFSRVGKIYELVNGKYEYAKGLQ